MSPIDYIIVGIILLVIGSAMLYIIKAKKSGKKCIGCPASSSCCSKSKCNCCSGCGTDSKADNDAK
jgi:hypothetical protein